VSASAYFRSFPLVKATQKVHIATVEKLLANMHADDVPALYWSQASTKALVFGFAQRGEAEKIAKSTQSLPIYVRKGGGGIVLVGPHLLSLDILFPSTHWLIPSDVSNSCHWLGEVWKAALHALDIPCLLFSPEDAARSQLYIRSTFTGLPQICYASTSPYEVGINGCKVVGFDILRKHNVTLFQAGLLLRWEYIPIIDAISPDPSITRKLREHLALCACGLDVVALSPPPVSSIIEQFEKSLTSYFG
jgi:lipoate-protein ligase A